MGKRRPLIIAGLALVALAAAAYLVTAVTSSAKDRPTLMYFRADL
jgi:hypothetical protein